MKYKPKPGPYEAFQFDAPDVPTAKIENGVRAGFFTKAGNLIQDKQYAITVGEQEVVIPPQIFDMLFEPEAE